MAGLLCLLVLCAAKAKTKTKSRVDPEPVDVAQINALLASREPDQMQDAVDAIRVYLENQPAYAHLYLRQGWLRVLYDNEFYEDVLDLATRSLQLSHAELIGLEYLQHLRVQCLLKLGKYDLALSNARSLFNASSMDGTAAALLDVAMCLNAVHPDDPEIVAKFRDEQMAALPPEVETPAPTTSPTTQASTQPTTQASTQAAVTQPATQAVAVTQPATEPVCSTKPAASQPAVVRSPIMDAVRVTDPVFDGMLKEVYGVEYLIHVNEFRDLVGEGNLQLLAGHAQKAENCFRRAMAIAEPEQMVQAREGLARCIKAQDGTIGRANLYIRSLRELEPGR